MKPRLVLLGARAGVLAIGLVVASGAALPAGQYEALSSFSASQVLPRELLRRPNYRIGGRVALENFQYGFKVHTKYGTFVIKGADLLRVRAREIAATAKLEEVGGAETAVGSAGRTALKPVDTAKDLITAPGQTIGDTFRGVGHIFGSAKAAMKATDPHKEGVLASVTGGSTARRKFAFDLGVDPNTSFAPLDSELKRVATASAIGGTGANVGLSFVAGNKRVAPIRQFVRFGGAPMLDTGKGIVSILPVDYLIWTPPLEQLVASAGGHGGGASSEIRIAGKASEMASARLAELGWKVAPKAAAQLGQ
jgi:hypothetical protein